jgi:hypothetical protein
MLIGIPYATAGRLMKRAAQPKDDIRNHHKHKLRFYIYERAGLMA